MSEKFKLVIGDKNLSTWSMRPWLVAKTSGLPFEEIQIRLDRPTTREEIQTYSPSGRVPVLIHGNTAVWDSLAICEYIHELAPEKQLWPTAPATRATARSYAAEMHSGFQGMRSQLSMDIRLKMEIRHLTPDTVKDIERVISLWDTALQTSKGPYLFGTQFGIADAFYTPVVFRFLSYGVKISNPLAAAYMRTIQEYPHVRSWVEAAVTEEAFRPEFK